MTSKKIYEYMSDNDWYVAQISSHYATGNTSFEDVPRDLYQLISDLSKVLIHDDDDEFSRNYLNVNVMRYSSIYQLISFLVDVINQEKARNLQVLNHGGAILILEEGQLYFVHIPEGGVDAEKFFGEEGLTPETLLIATRNEGKTAEFRQIFEKFGYQVQNLNDYPDLPEVEETGTTFEENARLKAETISKITGKMVLADDSGLQVDVLGGLPGVWSARFAGADATDDENNIKLLHELAMVFELKDRAAHFHTTLVVASPDRESLVVEANWPGYIAYEPKGDNGFGYDPLFLVGETGKTSAELTLEEKNAQSHRAQAVQKLVEVFPAWQNKQL